MKARPILFSAPMVCALLDGRKTQTRRVVNARYLPIVEECLAVNGKWVFTTMEYDLTTPYGKPGGLLWVREGFGYLGNTVSCGSDDAVITWLYLADGYTAHRKIKHSLMESIIPRQPDLPDPKTHWNEYDAALKKWWQSQKSKPSIHMPRVASRLTLEITGVRVERLKDISKADAIAEGCFFTDYGRKCFHQNKPPCDIGDCSAPESTHPQREGWMWDKTTSHEQCLNSARNAYGNLWNSINGAESWDANPWVWVIEFKVHHQNVDDFIKAVNSAVE